MGPPAFTNTAIFPTFASCPEVPPAGSPSAAELSDSPAQEQEQEQEWFLLGQVSDDMTIAKPTLVLADRTGAPFALVFDGLAPGEIDLRARGLRKGATAVVARARRTPPAGEGKRGFISVEKGRDGSVRAIPGPLARVLELGTRMAEDTGVTGEAGSEAQCESCGAAGHSLLRCTGCGQVRYCSKVSTWVAPPLWPDVFPSLWGGRATVLTRMPRRLARSRGGLMEATRRTAR